MIASAAVARKTHKLTSVLGLRAYKIEVYNDPQTFAATNLYTKDLVYLITVGSKSYAVSQKTPDGLKAIGDFTNMDQVLRELTGRGRP